jgi:CBS domain-containing protein
VTVSSFLIKFVVGNNLKKVNMDTKRSFQSAKDVMTKKIVLVDGMATAKEAVEIMRQEKAEALIVKKRHEQDAYGIVSIRDFIKGVIISDKTSEEVNVFEIMTKPVISVPADMDVRYVANLLMKVGLRMAPVRENDEYIGMVSLSDLILDNLLF